MTKEAALIMAEFIRYRMENCGDRLDEDLVISAYDHVILTLFPRDEKEKA